MIPSRNLFMFQCGCQLPPIIPCPPEEDKEGGLTLLSGCQASHIQEAPAAQGLSFTKNTTAAVSLGAVQIAPYPDSFPFYKSVFKKRNEEEAISDAQVCMTYLLIDQIFAKCPLICPR